MTPQDIIDEIQENALEWLEMSEEPGLMLAGIMASKIIELKNHIEYLEKRLQYVSVTK